MKRVLLVLFMIFTLALPLFTVGQSEAQETVVNWYAHAATFNDTQNTIIAAFSDKNPNIRVNLIELPENTTDKLQAMLIALQSGDSSIDICNADVTWAALFASAGLAEPMDKEFSISERKEFLPGTIEANMYDGHIWGIPFRTDAGVFYYRKDLLGKYGEKVPATWTELRDVAERIVAAERAAGNTMYGMAGSMQQYEGLTCNAVEWFYSYGGKVLDIKGNPVIDSEENIKALSIIKEMIDKDLYPQGILSYGSGDVRSLMFKGNLVFMRAWPKAWALSQNPENSDVVGKLGVAEIPGSARGTPGHSTLGGWQVFLAADSKNKDAAIKFMKFYSSEYAMKLHAINDSYLPARRSLYSDPEILKANPFFEMILGVLEGAIPRPTTPFYAETSSVIQVEVQNALTGKKTVAEALKDAQKGLEQIGE